MSSGKPLGTSLGLLAPGLGLMLADGHGLGSAVRQNLLVVLVLLIPWLFLCFLIGRTTSWYHRSPATWFLLALLLSPLVAFVFLHLAGDPQEALALQEKEERIRQQHPERQDFQEAALNEMSCPHCGAAVNPITEDGLHSSDSEPWRLICNQCQGTIEPDV